MKLDQVLPIPELVRGLSAVVVGVFDRDGRIVDGNRGLEYIIDMEDGSELAGRDVSRLFLQPRFETLQNTGERDGGEVYRGLINLGEAESRFRSLNGGVYRDGDSLILVAEFDIREMEELNDTVIQLHDEMATVQRELIRTNREMKRNEVRISELLRKDPLTELPNRRAFDERMDFEIARSRRGGGLFSLALLDIDHFKEINDNHGHNAGDRVLQYFAVLLADNMRTIDFFARIGGEEFAIILPDTESRQAVELTERLRRILESNTSAVIEEAVTASFGLTEYRGDDDNMETMMERADRALYRSKDEGRNRVSIYQPG